MPSDTAKPVIFLAFANDRGYNLRNLPVEVRGIRAELDASGRA